MNLSLSSPHDAARALGARAKALRLARNITQAALCQKTGISLPSLKRFENGGKASLDLIARVAFALDAADDLDRVFREDAPASLDEIMAPNQRRRASGQR